MKIGYIGISQYGDRYTIQKYPRKELLAQLGATHAEKMYVNTKSGKTRHIGYAINGQWIRVYEVHEWHKEV